MFFNLNITDYIVYHMKIEILSSVIFVTFVFGVNYVLTHVLNEDSNEDSNKDSNEDDQKKQGESESESESEIQMEDFKNTLGDNLDENKLENTLGDNLDENKLENKPDDPIQPCRTDGFVIGKDILDSVKNVIENEIKGDILAIQKILERKKYLLNLNDRLSEIKLKLQELQNELSRS